MAFLDVNPVAQGHLLIIPKVHCDYIFDLPPELFVGIFQAAKKLASALKKSTNCLKVGMSVVGVDIAHAHLHLIPINHSGDLDHSKGRQAKPESLAAMQAKLKSAL